jgi:hypothetical protein
MDQRKHPVCSRSGNGVAIASSTSYLSGLRRPCWSVSPFQSHPPYGRIFRRSGARSTPARRRCTHARRMQVCCACARTNCSWRAGQVLSLGCAPRRSSCDRAGQSLPGGHPSDPDPILVAIAVRKKTYRCGEEICDASGSSERRELGGRGRTAHDVPDLAYGAVTRGRRPTI